MRRKTDGELLKIRSTGSEYQKRLAEEELEDRRYARNVLPDRRRAWAALVLSRRPSTGRIGAKSVNFI